MSRPACDKFLQANKMKPPTAALPSMATTIKHINLEGAELAKFRTKICEHHRNKSCISADCCADSHCQTWQRRNPNEYVYSSKLCPDIEFIKKGNKMTLVRRCSRGRRCMFAHSKEEELYHPNMYKTKMCNSHPHCTRYYCPFAHKEGELRKPMPIAASPPNSPINSTFRECSASRCTASPVSGSTTASSASPFLSSFSRMPDTIKTQLLDEPQNSSIVAEGDRSKFIDVIPIVGKHENKASTQDSVEMLKGLHYMDGDPLADFTTTEKMLIERLKVESYDPRVFCSNPTTSSSLPAGLLGFLNHGSERSRYDGRINYSCNRRYNNWDQVKVPNYGNNQGYNRNGRRPVNDWSYSCPFNAGQFDANLERISRTPDCAISDKNKNEVQDPLGFQSAAAFLNSVTREFSSPDSFISEDVTLLIAEILQQISQSDVSKTTGTETLLGEDDMGQFEDRSST